MSDEHIFSDPIPLEGPIVRGDTTITELRLRKPDTGALRGTKLTLLGAMDVDQLALLIPRISVPPITSVEFFALEPADTMEVASACMDFFITRAQRAQLPTT